MDSRLVPAIAERLLGRREWLATAESCTGGLIARLLTDVPGVLSFITSFMTLLPGDVVLTGTPAGVGPLTNGCVVEVSVEGVGTLRNPVTTR